MTRTRYDSYSGSSNGSSGDDDQARELRMSTYTEIEFTPAVAMGSDSQYGQSLTTIFNDAELIDGALYVDVDSGYFKLFSWKSVTGFHPEEWYFERDDPISVDDADEIRAVDWGVSENTYELVGGRVPAITDEDGEVVQEATSKFRSIEGEGETYELGEWEDYGGDTVPLGSTITFWSASGDNGPSVKTSRAAELFTEYGNNAVVDDNDSFGWLADTTGNGILRNDVEDRRLRMLLVERDSSETDYSYTTLVLEDAETGASLGPYNRSETDSTDDGDASALEKAKKADAGAYPEPIADFISSGRNLNLTVGRAENLLNELIEDETNQLTEDMIQDHGGRDALVEEVV